MKHASLVSFLLLAALCCASAQADPLRADHPLLGAWKLELPNQHCRETYRFNKDGTLQVTSGEEVAESAITLSDKADAKGFFTWIDKIVKDNGKKDCSGEVTQVGREATSYILVHPSGNMFLICEKEDMNSCTGPAIRMKDGEK